MSALEKRQRPLETEPVQDAPTDSVKLNVGGAYFSTSVSILTREPNTFFSAMFSGRWDVKINPEDDAVFVDRDPTHFGLIIDYMRTGVIDLDNLSDEVCDDLREEADFYLIASLSELLQRPTFSRQVGRDIQLSQGRLRLHVRHQRGCFFPQCARDEGQDYQG